MGKFKSIARFFGGGRSAPPQPDYAAIQRQQQAEQQRLVDERAEELRVQGVSNYIDFMYDNPESISQRGATGQYFKAVSPGKIPTDALAGYKTDKSITAEILRDSPTKYFQNRSLVPSTQKGRIRLGTTKKAGPVAGGLLGAADVEKKTLLGA
jgi:hypothetical protein|tara:strand:+ start:144 stop:602 length:459 start_codon:yes stop_codon:yes gene_type:complete